MLRHDTLKNESQRTSLAVKMEKIQTSPFVKKLNTAFFFSLFLRAIDVLLLNLLATENWTENETKIAGNT